MILSLETAKTLKAGTILYYRFAFNSDGSPQRWRVTSVKTWKTRPAEVEVHLKYGLKTYDFATLEHLWKLATDEDDVRRPAKVGEHRTAYEVSPNEQMTLRGIRPPGFDDPVLTAGNWYPAEKHPTRDGFFVYVDLPLDHSQWVYLAANTVQGRKV